MTLIHCGNGNQTIRWLANAALARYDSNYGIDLGNPSEIRLKDGRKVSMDALVNSLSDESQVFVLFEAGTLSPYVFGISSRSKIL